MSLYNVILVSVVLCLAVNVALCRPRDSTVQGNDLIVPDNVESQFPVKAETTSYKGTIGEVKIPGRVSCEHEEATEDEICAEHCLPKGYNYGICVSKTCSCI